MTGWLNIFQRNMLQWNDLHPYNAVHVVKVPDRLDRERLVRAISDKLEACGLTNLIVDPRRHTLHYDGGPVQAVLGIVEGGARAEEHLSAEIERQLNTPFVLSEKVLPFRFFVQEHQEGFSFGLAYLHVVSDAEPIIYLVKDIIAGYRGHDARSLDTPVNLYPETYSRLYRMPVNELITWCASMPSAVHALRSSCRPIYRDDQDQRVSFLAARVESDRFSDLRAAARAWGVTFNDVLLALTLKSLGRAASRRFDAPRRRKIAVAAVVNIRKDLRVDPHRVFGVFLGSFTVAHEVPPGVTLQDLAVDVHRQTGVIKKYRLYLRSTLDMGLSNVLSPLFKGERRSRFYPKYFPLWAGTTNINLNNYWQEEAREGAFDYFRAVCTGPVTPLVLSFTTVGDHLNIGATFRKALYSAADVQDILCGFTGAHGSEGGEK